MDEKPSVLEKVRPPPRVIAETVTVDTVTGSYDPIGFYPDFAIGLDCETAWRQMRVS